MNPPGPAGVIDSDPWVPVVDKPSGQIYYWNTQTNETTHLGAPKPTSISSHPQGVPVQPQSQSLGSVMAEGFAFGVGSSVAHSMVGSFFGGGSHGDSGASNSSASSGDDGFDFDV